MSRITWLQQTIDADGKITFRRRQPDNATETQHAHRDPDKLIEKQVIQNAKR